MGLSGALAGNIEEANVKIRSREVQVFSVSFLDVISCALGGVLLLLIMLKPAPEPIPAPPTPDPPPPTPEGFVLPISLAVRLDWNQEVDIDLWVSDPGCSNEQPYVFYDERQSGVGTLMRDAINPRDRQWEVYFAIEPIAGVYEIHADYYEDSALPVEVTAAAELFPGDTEKKMRLEMEEPVTIRYANAIDGPDRRLLRFEIVKDDDGEFRLEDLGAG